MREISYRNSLFTFGQTVLPMRAPSQAQLLLTSERIWYESKVEAQQCSTENHNHNYNKDYNWRLSKSIRLFLLASIAVWWLNCLD